METKFDMNQWGYIKDKLQNMHPELNNADMLWGHFSRDELLEMISTKLGLTMKNLLDEIESLEYSQ